MATMTGKESDGMKTIYKLVELDFDAVEAYEAAIQRLKDQTSRTKLSEFKADHERHIRDLSDALNRHGITAPNRGDAKRVLIKGKVVIGQIAGDRGILQAMKTNEDDTNDAYERASNRSDLPPEILSLVERGLADERRHRDWIIQRIEFLKGAEQPASVR